MKFILNNDSLAPNFNNMLQNFILDPNPRDLTLYSCGDKNKEFHLKTLQKIASERKHKTSFFITVECFRLDYLQAILTTIEGSSCITQLVIQSSPTNNVLFEISKILTHPHCSIEKLSIQVGAMIDLLPLAQALKRNKTISELRFINRSFVSELDSLGCIFQALAGSPFTEEENSDSVLINTSVYTLFLEGFSIAYEKGTGLKSLNWMLEKNQTITHIHFDFGYLHINDLKKLEPSLIKNKRLSILSLSGLMDKFPKMTSYLPPYLEVLNLSNISVIYKNLIEDLICLIKECKKAQLSLHIIFNSNRAEKYLDNYREELNKLLLDDVSNVTLECDTLKEIPVYKQKQTITFFHMIATTRFKLYESVKEQQSSPNNR